MITVHVARHRGENYTLQTLASLRIRPDGTVDVWEQGSPPREIRVESDRTDGVLALVREAIEAYQREKETVHG